MPKFLNNKDFNKTVLVVTFVFSLAFLVFSMIFIFNKMSEPPSISIFLPNKETVFFAEGKTEDLASLAEFNKYFSGLIRIFLDINPDKDIYTWGGKYAGVAYFYSKDKISSIIAVKADNKKKASSFASSYCRRKQCQYVLTSGFLIISRSKEIIDKIKGGKYARLPKNSLFIKTFNNLPHNFSLRAYINIQKAAKIKKISQNAIINMIKIGGATLKKKRKNWKINLYIPADKKLFKNIKFNKNKGFSLSALAPNDSFFYIEGNNAEKYVLKILETAEKESIPLGISFENYLNGIIKKYIGNVLLRNEILSLFNNKIFVFSGLSKEDITPHLSLILSPKNMDKQKIINIFTAIKNSLPNLFVKKSLKILPDRSRNYFFVPDPSKIKEKNINYKEITIKSISLASLPWSINMAVFPDKIIFASHIDLIKKSIDLSENKKNIKIYSDSPEFVFNLNLEKIRLWFSSYFLEKKKGIVLYLLKDFSSVSLETFVFSDGISAQGSMRF